MIPLRSLFSTLAFLSSSELFQFSMQSFYGPTHLVLFLNNLRVHRTLGTIRDHPINVAICGDHLEKLHFKWNFFEFNANTRMKLFISPLNLLQRNVTLFLTQTDETILF